MGVPGEGPRIQGAVPRVLVPGPETLPALSSVTAKNAELGIELTVNQISFLPEAEPLTGAKKALAAVLRFGEPTSDVAI